MMPPHSYEAPELSSLHVPVGSLRAQSTYLRWPSSLQRPITLPSQALVLGAVHDSPPLQLVLPEVIVQVAPGPRCLVQFVATSSPSTQVVLSSPSQAIPELVQELPTQPFRSTSPGSVGLARQVMPSGVQSILFSAPVK
jgi:hypothetical protein